MRSMGCGGWRAGRAGGAAHRQPCELRVQLRRSAREDHRGRERCCHVGSLREGWITWSLRRDGRERKAAWHSHERAEQGGKALALLNVRGCVPGASGAVAIHACRHARAPTASLGGLTVRKLAASASRTSKPSSMCAPSRSAARKALRASAAGSEERGARAGERRLVAS
jgi:hypothetical protein